MRRIPETATKIFIAGASIAAPFLGLNAHNGATTSLTHADKNISAATNEHGNVPDSFTAIVKKLVEADLKWKTFPDYSFIGRSALVVLPDKKEVEMLMIATTSSGNYVFNPNKVFHADEEVYPRGTVIRRKYAVPEYSYAFNKGIGTNGNNKVFDSQVWYTGVTNPEYTLNPNPGKNLRLDVNDGVITYKVGNSPQKQYKNEAKAKEYQEGIVGQFSMVLDDAVNHRNLPNLPEPKV
jgi:hypothetical protein